LAGELGAELLERWHGRAGLDADHGVAAHSSVPASGDPAARLASPVANLVTNRTPR
jgi:hypothetical protein